MGTYYWHRLPKVQLVFLTYFILNHLTMYFALFLIASLAAANAAVLDKGETRTTENYFITLVTGDVADAGTDSTIYATLIGSTGQMCGPHELDNSYNNFGRGNIDTFLVQCDYLGPVMMLQINKDNYGGGPGWFLEKVSVYDERDWKAYSYVLNDWVDYHTGSTLMANNL